MKMVVMASILALAGGVAQAATCEATYTNKGNGKAQTVSYLLEQSGGSITAQCYSNNDTNTIDADFTIGGISGWELADKTDDAKPYVDGGFSQFGPGKWSIVNPMGYESVLVTLKQGRSFAAFLLDSSARLEGIWNTFGPGKSVGGLSHASVYFSGQPAPVPLPAGAALLPAGLAALAFLRRRRKAA